MSSALLALVVASGIAACKRAPAGDSTSGDAGDTAADDSATVDSSDENPLSQGIREDFAKKYSCPEGRVVVKERPDLDPLKTLAPNETFPVGTPSDEVRNDPERYAKWQADRDASVQSAMGQYTQNTMFEVTGCGHTELLGCHARRGTSARGGTVIHTTQPVCIAPPGAPGKAPGPLTLENLGTAALQSAVPARLEAPSFVGKSSAFDPVANIDWASSIATAWSPDAQLFWIDFQHAQLDGTLDLTKPFSTIAYHFKSAAKGDFDFALELSPFADRQRDAGPTTVKVTMTPHERTSVTLRDPASKPTCALARAAAALRKGGAMAKASPVQGLGARLSSAGGKLHWSFQYVLSNLKESSPFMVSGNVVTVDVDATTCAATPGK